MGQYVKTIRRSLCLGCLRSSFLSVDDQLNVLCSRKYTLVRQESMSQEGSRYFKNSLQDYTGGEIALEPESWKPFILEMAQECLERQPNTKRNVDGGLYVGTAGIAYMFYHLGTSPVFSDKEGPDLLKKGLQIIKGCEEIAKKSGHGDPTDNCSFLLGRAGISAVSAALHEANGDKEGAKQRLDEYCKAGAVCKPIHFVGFGGDELFVGRAGYICGALWLKEVFKKDIVPPAELEELCKVILQSGHKTASHFPLRDSPVMYSYYETYYLGAAHGISSILQMILSCQPMMQKASTNEKKDIFAAVDFVQSLQYHSGNFPCAADDMGESNLVHWCHGAPGIVYLMAKAYLETKSQKYLDSCLQCGEITWKKGLLKKGPGICHGVAGNGYVFLLLYRLTGDKKHLHRAAEFARFLRMPEFKKARTPDSPYSLYEGTAGTACFLTDLLNPSTAAFPFMDVFAS